MTTVPLRFIALPLTRGTPPEYCPSWGSSGVLAGAFGPISVPERLSAGDLSSLLPRWWVTSPVKRIWLGRTSAMCCILCYFSTAGEKKQEGRQSMPTFPGAHLSRSISICRFSKNRPAWAPSICVWWNWKETGSKYRNPFLRYLPHIRKGLL